MFRSLASKTLAYGALALSMTLAGLPPAEAAVVKVRFTPPYGVPFPDLEWFGEAVIDDGGCTEPGFVLNFTGPCAGKFSIASATLSFADVSAPTVALQTFSLTGAQIIGVDRDSPLPEDWMAVVSSPFNPVQGAIDQTKFNGQQAYFSLIFVGGYAQLFWFKDNPGSALVDPLQFPYLRFPASLTYGLCYLAGPGDENNDDTLDGINSRLKCGLSSNVGGDSGKLLFADALPVEVPEPSSYALLLAGLGALGAATRRRSRSR